MSIADRTLDPPGDFGSEHTDALCTRDMGWLMGWAATPQEVFDKTLIAYAIGEDPRVLLPQMVAQDGYFVSHIAGEVEMPTAEQVDAYLPPYQLPFPLDPRRPVSHGPQIHPEQGPPLQLERARAMEDAIPVIRRKTDEFATAFGRQYPHLVEEYLLDDAEMALVISGGHAVTCRAAIRHAARAGREDRHGPAAVDPPVPQRRPARRAARRQGGRRGGDQPRPRRVELRRHPVPGRDHRAVSGRATGRWSPRSWPGSAGRPCPWPSSTGWPANSARRWQRGRVEKAAHWVGFEAPLAQGTTPWNPRNDRLPPGLPRTPPSLETRSPHGTRSHPP